MALAVAASANPFEDTPTPPEGRWNSGRQSSQGGGTYDQRCQ